MKLEINRDPTPTTKSHPPENEVPGTSSISGAVLNVSTSSKTGAGFNVFHLRRRILWLLVILIMALVVNGRVVFLLRLALRICVMISTLGALIICLIIIVNSEGSLFGPLLVDRRKFEIHTLPVDGRAVPDGDGLTVYVSVSDPRESSRVPHEVTMAFVERQEARGGRNHTKSNALQKQIKDAGYNVLYINKKEILARKYRIRLRGIDAPENAMPYGEEAKNELVKIVEGKCLRILIFDEDPYGRFVGDVYCNDNFVQKIMLKKGLAWHYTAYDKRPELAKWEKYAKEKRIGLWALENPEMPWKWRKNHPQSRY